MAWLTERGRQYKEGVITFELMLRFASFCAENVGLMQENRMHGSKMPEILFEVLEKWI